MKVRINPGNVVAWLLTAIVGLTLLHVGAYFLRRAYEHSGLISSLVKLFDLSKEQNLPTLYACLTLLFCSILTALLARVDRERGFRLYWMGLAFVFAFLAFDEYASFHERVLGKMMRSVVETEGIFHFSWIIPYAIFGALLLLFYSRFLWRLPRRTGLLIIVSGLIYVGGALVMEAVEGWYRTSRGLTDMNYDVITIRHSGYFVLTSTEEVLEMLGILVLIHALLSYLRSRLEHLTLDLTGGR